MMLMEGDGLFQAKYIVVGMLKTIYICSLEFRGGDGLSPKYELNGTSIGVSTSQVHYDTPRTFDTTFIIAGAAGRLPRFHQANQSSLAGTTWKNKRYFSDISSKLAIRAIV